MTDQQIIAALICEDANIVHDWFAAVACVECKGKWLLGLAKTTDDRNNKWVFPGGGREDGETPQQTAVRECREETGIRATVYGGPIKLPSKDGVVFLYCKAFGNQRIKQNEEFRAMGWLTTREMRELPLYYNVLDLIKKLS